MTIRVVRVSGYYFLSQQCAAVAKLGALDCVLTRRPLQVRGCDVENHAAEREIVGDIAERPAEIICRTLNEKSCNQKGGANEYGDTGNYLHDACATRIRDDECAADQQIRERRPHQIEMR